MGDIWATPQQNQGFSDYDRYRRWSKMTPSQMLAKIKNPMALTLYNDLMKAQQGGSIYSENDIRNAGLVSATSAAPAWEAQKVGMAGAAAGAGMLGSGFYQRAVGQAEAQKNASVSAQALATSSQMRDANNTYDFNLRNTSAQLLGSWLDTMRKQRLNAIQMANMPGASSY
jgi:hypothetical protein